MSPNRFLSALLLVSAAAALPLAPSMARDGDAARKPGTRFRDCGKSCPEMVVIPAGRFRMGADAGEEGRPEGSVRDIAIPRAFAVGAREVSNAEYARFISETGRTATRGCRSYNRAANSVDVSPAADFRQPGEGAGGGAPAMPVVCVSWTDAKAYTAWLSGKTGKPYRLLSEAEWEYAARAGSSAQYPWGDRIEDGCRAANVLDRAGAGAGVLAVFGGQSGTAAAPVPSAACDDRHAGAAPVGSYRPNAFGLYDMTGNVWEWVEDCYVAPYPADAPTDGRAYQVTGDCPRRSVRSGSWISVPFRNRVSWRGRDPETLVSWIFGFRIARDLAESTK
jgi:formylglycine-generating enzyme required for sulfatase activity